MTAREHELRLHMKALTKEQGDSKLPILYPSISKENQMSSPQKPLEPLPKKAPKLVTSLNQGVYEKLEKMFGRKHQLAVAIEECAELQKELTKTMRGKENDMKICEEIADVEICLDQLKLFYDPTGANVALFKDFKVRRLENFFISGGHK